MHGENPGATLLRVLPPFCNSMPKATMNIVRRLSGIWQVRRERCGLTICPPVAFLPSAPESCGVPSSRGVGIARNPLLSGFGTCRLLARRADLNQAISRGDAKSIYPVSNFIEGLGAWPPRAPRLRIYS